MNFVFTLLDKGCFLTLIKDNALISQAFFPSIQDFESSKEYEIFSKTSRGTIHIFLDTHEQHYERFMFPDLGRRKIHSMIQQRCRTENPLSHIIQARQESKNGFLFADIILEDQLQAWLTFLGNSDHLLQSPRLLPLELETLFQSPLVPAPPPTLCTIVTYHEEGMGLRQIIFLEGKLCAVRLVTLTSSNSTEEITFETTALVNYLVDNHAVQQNSVGFIFLGHKKIWTPLKHFPHIVIDWSAHHPATPETPPLISTWSGLGLFLIQKKPLLSLRTLSLRPYEMKEKQRKIFLGGGILCLTLLGIGGTVLMDHLQLLKARSESLTQKNFLSTTSPTKLSLCCRGKSVDRSGPFDNPVYGTQEAAT
jgi:hypothetical protein